MSDRTTPSLDATDAAVRKQPRDLQRLAKLVYVLRLTGREVARDLVISESQTNHAAWPIWVQWRISTGSHSPKPTIHRRCQDCECSC